MFRSKTIESMLPRAELRSSKHIRSTYSLKIVKLLYADVFRVSKFTLFSKTFGSTKFTAHEHFSFGTVMLAR